MSQGEWRQRGDTGSRATLPAILYTVWTLLDLLVLPLSWAVINDVFWSSGVGPLLTERLAAAVHHRVMSTLQEFEKQGERMAYLQGLDLQNRVESVSSVLCEYCELSAILLSGKYLLPINGSGLPTG